MFAIFDVVRVSLRTLFNCFVSSDKLAARSWPTEYCFRLAKRMLEESKTKPIPWLRERQNLLKMVSPALLKTHKQSEIIAGVPCISHTPKNLPDPDVVIVYFHGGGYVVGSADGYGLTLTNLALAAEAKVVGVDYRLAPEHPLPAAQDDCHAVSKSILEACKGKGKKVWLAGDSAGGGLCLSTIQMLAQSSSALKVDGCVLISPWLTPLDEQGLELTHECSDILDRALLAKWVSEFMVEQTSDEKWVDFRDFDLSILPSLYIQVAGAEVFTRQIDGFITKLKQKNISHRYDVFEQQFHVFQTFAPLVKQADEAIEKIAGFIRHA